MLNLSDVSLILADGFFSGDTTIAGLAIFTVALAVVFSISRNVFATLVISLPMALVFAGMGALSEDVMIVLIIVIVLGLAFTGRNIWSR